MNKILLTILALCFGFSSYTALANEHGKKQEEKKVEKVETMKEETMDEKGEVEGDKEKK